MVKGASVRILESLKETLQNGNLAEAAFLGTRLTEISVVLDSKVGVLIGETVESSLLQLHQEITRYDLDPDKHAKEMHDLALLVDALIDSVKSGVEENVYSALIELRFHATKRQHGMPGEYGNPRDAKHTSGHLSVLPKQRDYEQIIPLIEKMSEQERMILGLQEEISELQERYRQMQLDDMREQNNAGREDLEYIFGAEPGDGNTDSIDGMLKDYVDPKQNSQELVRSVRDT